MTPDDPGFWLDIATDYVLAALAIRGAIAYAGDVARLTRGLRNMWRWGTWA